MLKDRKTVMTDKQNQISSCTYFFTDKIHSTESSTNTCLFSDVKLFIYQVYVLEFFVFSTYHHLKSTLLFIYKLFYNTLHTTLLV